MMSPVAKAPAPPGLSARIDALPVSGWHRRLLALCCLGVVIENYDQISIAFAMPAIVAGWGLSPVAIGALLSASSLGLLAGAALFGFLSDRVGRKACFALTTAIYSLFAFLSAFAADYAQLYALRVLAGLGLGGFVPVGVAYVSEYAPAAVKGRFVAVFSIGNGIGYILAVLASMFLVPSGPQGWRLVLGLGVVGLLALPLFMALVPESARWLAGKGRYKEAVAIVERVERASGVASPLSQEDAVFGAMLAARAGAVDTATGQAVDLQREPGGEGRGGRLFGKESARGAILAAIVWFAAGYTFYGFIQWMPSFLTRNLGYEIARGYWFTLIAAIVGTGTPALVAGLATDRLGARKVMMVSMGAYALSGFAFLLAGGWSILFLYWFSSAMSSMTYVFTPRLFPHKLRGTGLGFASSTGRLAGFVAPMAIGLIVGRGGLAGVVAANAMVLVLAIVAILVLDGGGKDGRL